MSIDHAPALPEPPFGPHPAYTWRQAHELGAAFAGVPIPTLFELVRLADPTGVSRTLGRVAHGIVFPYAGGAVYRWHQSAPPPGWPAPVRQFGLYESIAEVIAVHGHGGSTVVHTVDATDAKGEQLSAAGYRLEIEAFAVVDTSGDVPEWGVWIPGDDRAVTWAPPITPISGRRQADRHTVWRSMDELSERVDMRTGPGRGRIVWLASVPGRALVGQVRGAHMAGLRHSRQMMELATRWIAANPIESLPG